MTNAEELLIEKRATESTSEGRREQEFPKPLNQPGGEQRVTRAGTRVVDSIYESSLKITLITMMETLDKSGTDSEPDTKNSLIVASQAQNLELCQLLIAQGANVNLPNQHGLTPLREVARRGNYRISRLFLECGADVSARDQSGLTIFQVVIIFGQESTYASIALLLLSFGCDIAKYRTKLSIRHSNQSWKRKAS